MKLKLKILETVFLVPQKYPNMALTENKNKECEKEDKQDGFNNRVN